MSRNLYEVIIFQYKPEHRTEFVALAKNSKSYAVFEQNGGKVLATMEVGVGGTYEAATIIRWGNMKQRMGGFMAAMQDKEILNEFQRIHEMVYGKETYLMEAFKDGPSEAIGKAPLVLESLALKCHPFKAATAVDKAVQCYKDKFGAENIPDCGLLVPTLAYSKYQLFQLYSFDPKKMSGDAMQKLMEHERTPAAWDNDALNYVTGSQEIGSEVYDSGAIGFQCRKKPASSRQ